MRLPSWPNTVSGMSIGFCVTKYTPTPFERIKRTTCSIFSSNTLGASLNNKCASSKKNANFGLSTSPTSGKVSNSSDNIHNKNAPYTRGEFISLSAARMFTTPLPSTVCIMSAMLSIGSPKNCPAPCSSIANKPRCTAPIDAAETLP